MNRRDFPGTAGPSTAALAVSGCSGIAQSADVRTEESLGVPVPLPRQAAWQDFELGLVYHFDLGVHMPGGHHERSGRAKLDANLYNPAKLDTDPWLRIA